MNAQQPFSTPKQSNSFGISDHKFIKQMSNSSCLRWNLGLLFKFEGMDFLFILFFPHIFYIGAASNLTSNLVCMEAAFIAQPNIWSECAGTAQHCSVAVLLNSSILYHVSLTIHLPYLNFTASMRKS